MVKASLRMPSRALLTGRPHKSISILRHERPPAYRGPAHTAVKRGAGPLPGAVVVSGGSTGG